MYGLYVHMLKGQVITMKTIGAAEFKARCLRVIGQLNKDHELWRSGCMDRRI